VISWLTHWAGLSYEFLLIFFSRNTPEQYGDRGGTVVKVLCYKSEGRCSIPDDVIGIFH